MPASEDNWLFSLCSLTLFESPPPASPSPPLFIALQQAQVADSEKPQKRSESAREFLSDYGVGVRHHWAAGTGWAAA